jgi:uncharacterized protein (DUF58 family)
LRISLNNVKYNMRELIKTAIFSPVRSYKLLQKRFYTGPDWIDLPEYLQPTKKGYRSPTLLLLAWLYAWYIRILTVPGRMMFSVVFLIVLYGSLMDGPIRIMAFSLIALLTVDFTVGFLFRPKLDIEHDVPKRVRSGNMIRIDYTISNSRSFPVWNIHLDPVHQQGWIRLEADIASLDSIPAKGTIRMSAFLQSEKRGEYVLKPSFASSAFPFGIIKWTCRKKNPQRVLVYPAYEPLNSVKLPLNSRFQKEGVSLVSNVGESMEFHACREFRTGDNPKHIHWPTTARKNDLIVREFQEEYLCRIALIVDTFIPSKESFFTLRTQKVFPEFEAALSLTAALSHYLAHGDYIVDIFAAGPDVYHFKGGRSLAQLDQILDILACLEPNRKEPLKKLETTVIEEMASIGSAMLLLLKWDKDRKRLVDQLHEYGIELKIVLISNEEFTELPDDALIFSPEDVFNGHIRDL